MKILCRLFGFTRNPGWEPLLYATSHVHRSLRLVTHDAKKSFLFCFESQKIIVILGFIEITQFPPANCNMVDHTFNSNISSNGYKGRNVR